MNKTVDFLTFGKNGVQATLLKQFNAVVNTADVYNFTVRMWNEISKTIKFSTVKIILKEFL